MVSDGDVGYAEGKISKDYFSLKGSYKGTARYRQIMEKINN